MVGLRPLWYNVYSVPHERLVMLETVCSNAGKDIALNYLWLLVGGEEYSDQARLTRSPFPSYLYTQSE